MNNIHPAIAKALGALHQCMSKALNKAKATATTTSVDFKCKGNPCSSGTSKSKVWLYSNH